MGSGNDGRTLTHTEGIWLSASRNLECSDMEDYYNRPARGGGEEHGVRRGTFGSADVPTEQARALTVWTCSFHGGQAGSLRRVGNPPVAPVHNRRAACQAAPQSNTFTRSQYQGGIDHG